MQVFLSTVHTGENTEWSGMHDAGHNIPGRAKEPTSGREPHQSKHGQQHQRDSLVDDKDGGESETMEEENDTLYTGYGK